MTSVVHLPVNISPDFCPTVFNLTLAHTFSRCSPALPKHLVLPKLCLFNTFTPWGLVLMIHSQVILLITPSPLPFSPVDALLHNSFSCISFSGYNEPLKRSCKYFAKFILPSSFCQIHFRGSSQRSAPLRNSEGKRLFRVALRCAGIRKVLKVKTVFL